VLNKLNIDFQWFVLGLNSVRKNMIDISPQKKFVKLSGKADANRNKFKNNFKLHKGHKPLSLYLAFTSAFVAKLSGSNYIISSNEKSANYENLDFHGVKINHQYTKSYQFESEFANYIKLYLSPQLSYFSLLRPLYELQILKIFAKFDKYHNTFVSCNNTIHESHWCGRCSKCAFIYLGLYPFLNSIKLSQMIGKNMLNDPLMLPRYLALTGVSGHKPFECVGTVEENMAAMYLASLKPNPPFVVEYFIKNVPSMAQSKAFADEFVNNYDSNNLIPSKLSTKVSDVLKDWLK